MTDDTGSEPGSVAVDHEEPAAPWVISPTTHGKWRNTIAPILKPVACWRIHHAYFRFDSSVILPTIHDELNTLRPLIKEDRLATIFGHADPVGTVDYNSHLSARRARALFGLLTRNAEIWLHLFGDRQPYDQWGLASTQIMLAALTDQNDKPYYLGDIDGAFGPSTDEAIRAFQQDENQRNQSQEPDDDDAKEPLAVDGVAGAKTRKRLYLRYMDSLTGTPGQPMMKPDQFLGDPADNADPQGKGRAAFQGCGEYNPILLFSDADEKKYAKQTDKSERNARNAPNRRAMLFFFSKKKLLPFKPEDAAKAWPCPAWDEGPSACEGQLWPDSDARLANGQTERRYDQGDETMACLWYDRFARLSPCERAPTGPITVRLLSNGRKPCGGIVAKVWVEGAPQTIQADQDGWIRIPRSLVGREESLVVEYQPDDSPAPEQMRLQIRLELPSSAIGAKQRLGNLGYRTEYGEAYAVDLFQQDWGLERSGNLTAETRRAIARVHDEGKVNE